MKRYGEWAIITGASSGIGKAFAERLAQENINCILISNEDNKLQEVSEDLRRKYSIETVVYCCDLSKTNFIDAIKQKLQNYDIGILVNCASFGILSPFLDIPLKKYIECINVSVLSYVILTYEVLTKMKERKNGAIIFVSSVNAFSPVGYSSIYTSSKAFELYLGEALWKEFKDTGIDILTVCPAATKTNFQTKASTRIPTWALKAEEVVNIGLKYLGKRPSVVIGFRGKIYYLLTKLLPRKESITFATWAINSTLRIRSDEKKIKLKNEIFTLEVLQDTNVIAQRKPKIIGQMANLTKQTWGDPSSLLEKWLSLAEILIIAKQSDEIKGFAIGRTFRDDVLLFPATIIHPDSQKKGLGMFLNLYILSLIWNVKLKKLSYGLLALLKPYYITFRTPNPILYKSISSKIKIVPSIKGNNPSLYEQNIGKDIAKTFSPECDFDSKNFVIKGALKPFPGLIYDFNRIPWSNDKEVNQFFEDVMKLKEKEGNELVIVGTIPKIKLVLTLVKMWLAS